MNKKTAHTDGAGRTNFKVHLFDRKIIKTTTMEKNNLQPPVATREMKKQFRMLDPTEQWATIISHAAALKIKSAKRTDILRRCFNMVNPEIVIGYGDIDRLPLYSRIEGEASQRAMQIILKQYL